MHLFILTYINAFPYPPNPFVSLIWSIRCDLAPRVRALSQLVSGLESLQRLGASFGVLRSVKTSNVSFRSNNGGITFSGSKAGAGLGLLEFGSPTREKNTPGGALVAPANPVTTPPRIVNVTGVSVEADLNSCAGRVAPSPRSIDCSTFLSHFSMVSLFRTPSSSLFLPVAASEVLAAQEAALSEYTMSRENEADTPDGRGPGAGGVSSLLSTSSSASVLRVDEGNGSGGRSTPSRSHSPIPNPGGGITPQASSTGLRLPLYDSLLFEVAIAVVAAEEEEPLHFETVYCGNSTRFTQAGLSPNCTYLLRCRASVGPLLLEWSAPVKFHTEPGVCFGFDPMKCGSDILLGDDNLSASYAGDDNWSTLLGTRPFSCGRVSWEIRVLHSSTAYVFVGVATASADLNTFLGGCANGWGFIGEQALYHNRENVKGFGEAFTAGDTVGVHLDFHAGTLSFSRNGKSLGVAFDKICGELYPAVAFYNVGQELEIVPNSFTSSCPQDTIPCTPARLNLSAVSNLTELLLCINTGVPLSLRTLTAVAEHCNQWAQGKQIRLKVLSGRCMFISTDEQAPLLRQYGLGVGQRVRTPLGIAQLEGSACGRLWFTFAATGNTWCFTNHQIRVGREKGFFTQCTYDATSSTAASVDCSIAAAAAVDNDDSAAGGGAAPAHATASTSTTALTTTEAGSGTGVSASSAAAAAASTSFDVAFLQDTLDPARWPAEMDALLVNFVTKIADSNDLSPWAVSCDHICEDFRALQQQLTRHVMTHADLSHKWGISGPKRKAVLGRLGLLRYLNHELDMYLPAVLNNTESVLTKAAAAAALADKTNAVLDKKGASAAGNGGQEDFFPTYVTSIETMAVVSREGEVLPVSTSAASYATTNTATNGNSGCGSNSSVASMLSMVDGAFVALVSCDGGNGLSMSQGLTGTHLWDYHKPDQQGQGLAATGFGSPSGGTSASTASGGGGSASSSSGMAALGYTALRQVIAAPVMSLSWSPLGASKLLSYGPGLLPSSRHRIFADFKMIHFWEVVNRSAARPVRTEDDYDYPEDLPQVKINRFKSFRAREASELMGIPGDDLLSSSLFCQLWKELKHVTNEKLRMSYTHPMDDGQARTFKVGSRTDNQSVN